MIEMSLDVSKNHALKKIMNNLNWSSEDTNVFYLLYISWQFVFVNISKCKYSRNQRIFFIKDYDFTHTKNLWFSNFERRFFQQLNMKISLRAVNLEKNMEINKIFLSSHHQVKFLSNMHKRLLDFLHLLYRCFYEGETKMCSALFFR